MTETERLAKIHAYLDCIERHIALLPDKTDPDALNEIANRLEKLCEIAANNSVYSYERRQDAAEARERVSAMVPSVS